MKTKSKQAKLKRKSEFRYHKQITIKKNGKITKLIHPAYIIFEKGNIYIYVSITHSKNVENMIVIKLRKNPNPNDTQSSYYIDEIKEDTKDKFGSRHKNWIIDIEDDIEIREKIKKKR